MIAYEKVLQDDPPELVVVVGDVNSTIAATLSAVKLGIKVAHLEAGLRSFDRTMPEEVNRLLTDAIADLLWTPSEDGDRNLKREGVADEKIVRVGNIMIDSLEMLRDRIESDDACERLSLERGNFALATLHRPANVDHRGSLTLLCEKLAEISNELPLIFPIHPRTLKNINRFGLGGRIENNGNLKLLEPLNYISFMNLVLNCRLAVTDSGGIQEETTYLGIPCITLRPNTERPVTIEKGTNRLCNLENLNEAFQAALANDNADRPKIDMWDGRTADRVVESIKAFLAI
jgi:UDP-N-acetylglucosamine 2-epimerase (non-hydrolysing)